MRQWMAIGAAGLLLAGCIPAERPPAPPPPAPAGTPETITYETGPCFGACPVYSVSVTAKGEGTFTGKRFTTVSGELRFKVTPAQFAAFKAALAPWRPAGGSRRIGPGAPSCPEQITDQPSVDVKWLGGGAPTQELYFYYGCASGNRAMADALGNAPDALPIGAWIGEQP